ncbi:MAG: FAD-dependent oxidoreductase, partial [Gemmatimonadetes bacterium]|nr:FAD-dependent oxidoreductase [Gemmatimonadota bacterium]
MSLDRRRFLQVSGAQLGLVALGARSSATALERVPVSKKAAPAFLQSAPEVAVIGAGAFGGWTALYLRERGVSATLIDQYGPGNGRATSGGETRQIRPGYGNEEPYTRSAITALNRWKEWQSEWGKSLERSLYVRTGRLILRPAWDDFLNDTKRVLDKYGMANEVLDHDELARRYPQINLEENAVALYEHDAGILRARQACEAVAAAFQKQGGRMILAHAAPGRRAGGRLQEIALSNGERLSAQAFVFACGPWLPKVLPEVMKDRLRTPLSFEFFFGTPAGDQRFMAPHLPNFRELNTYGFTSIGND